MVMRTITKEIEDKLKMIALKSFVNADIQNPNPSLILSYYEMLKNEWINNRYEIEE